MTIEEVLREEANRHALRLEVKDRTLQRELTNIEARKAEIQAVRDKIGGASERAVNFRAKLGTNFQCPCCWIENEVGSTIAPIEGDETTDRFLCATCGQQFAVTF